MSEETIKLGMLLMVREDRVDVICLETDVAVSAKNKDEALCKMDDAIMLYLRSFSEADLSNRRYIRRAPMHYRISAFLVRILQHLQCHPHRERTNKNYHVPTANLAIGS